MTAEEVRDRWMSELTAGPGAACGRGAAGEHLVRQLLTKTAITILHADPRRTWIWFDLHLGDRSIIEAWGRPFRSVGHMNRALLAEWRRRVCPGEAIICLGDVAHADAWRDDSRLRLDVAGCPGARELILGNHDLFARAELTAAGFDRQRAGAVCDTDPVLVLTHSPLRPVPPNTVNVHGRLHGAASPPSATAISPSNARGTDRCAWRRF